VGHQDRRKYFRVVYGRYQGSTRKARPEATVKADIHDPGRRDRLRGFALVINNCQPHVVLVLQSGATSCLSVTFSSFPEPPPLVKNRYFD
jgi:hypothetical protein